jgi:hypothetical protein
MLHVVEDLIYYMYVVNVEDFYSVLLHSERELRIGWHNCHLQSGRGCKQQQPNPSSHTLNANAST